MQSVRKSKNRRGATSIFLAIILSALILVECTYIALVEDLRSELAFNRAVKVQVDTYLAQYDRQLFKTYGIYAFNMNAIDDDIFREILAQSGVEYGDVLAVEGINSFDTGDLRRAISVYYSYRASGVLINYFSGYIAELLRQIDDIAIVETFNSMTSSGAANLIMQILDKSVDISSYLTQLAEDFGITDSEGQVILLDSLIEKIDAMNSAPPDIGDDFDPGDMSFISDLTQRAIGAYDLGADFIENVVFHGYAVNYAVYNFDCCLDDDAALDGTPFSTFHAEEHHDVEYILTGLDGRAGALSTFAMIYGVLFLKNFISIMADQEKMAVVHEIAAFLSILIEVISVGTVVASPELCEIYVLSIMSEYYSSSDLSEVLSGGTASFMAIGEFEGFALEYRDLVTIYMNLVSDDLMLSRMCEVINRDFEGYACGIEVSGVFHGEDVIFDRTYELYEEVSYDAA